MNPVVSEVGPVPSSAVLDDRYRLGEVLGRGGMGEVRAGVDLRLGRQVAVKLLRPDMAAEPRVRERFEAEARAAASLNHVNVVAVYDTGEHEGIPYLVMERLPGRTLADELVEGPLPPERARRLGLEILAALETAHGAGIVHRDIKPGNVLFTAGGTAKLADFGIAKSTEGLDLTTTGMLLGTPAYLAPERVAGEPATPRSDLYAVGVLLYEALTGQKPFAAETPLALANAIQRERAPALSEVCPGVPASLARAVERAMAKDPRRRFRTATQMAVALAAGQATAAPEPEGATVAVDDPNRTLKGPLPSFRPADRGVAGVASAGWAWARRRPAVVAAALVVMLLLAVLLATGGEETPAPAQEPTTTVQPAPSPSVAPALDRALDKLEERVRP